jgi:hypothetical protein
MGKEISFLTLLLFILENLYFLFSNVFETEFHHVAQVGLQTPTSTSAVLGLQACGTTILACSFNELILRQGLTVLPGLALNSCSHVTLIFVTQLMK